MAEFVRILGENKMANGNAGNGDQLARGSTKASYLSNESGKITDDAWSKAFDDLDIEKFKKEGMPKVKGTPKTSDLG